MCPQDTIPASRVPRVCAYCGRDFLAPRKSVRIGNGRYCSRVCANAGRRAQALSRFWAKIDQSAGPDSCWPWLGARDKNSYGLTTMPGDRMRRVSKIVWELAQGKPFPADLWALHTCDNPPCSNPAHIYAGTPQQNADDRVNAGHTEHMRGERNRHAVLTADDVREVRKLYAQGGHSLRRLAALYGVSDFAIRCIVKRRTWRHIE